jgi:hypothetical protein
MASSAHDFLNRINTGRVSSRQTRSPSTANRGHCSHPGITTVAPIFVALLLSKRRDMEESKKQGKNEYEKSIHGQKMIDPARMNASNTQNPI